MLKDVLGSLTSLACLAHCLALPAFLSAGFFVSLTHNGHVAIHLIFFIFAALVVWLRLKNKDKVAFFNQVLLLTGITFLGVGLAAELLFHAHDSGLVATLVGSTGLVIGHTYNIVSGQC